MTADGSVVCAGCGARMKADRPACLRCGEPLVPIEAAAAPPDATGQFSQRTTFVLGVSASVIIVGLIGVLWPSRAPETAAGARATLRVGLNRPSPAQSESESLAYAAAYDAATFLDAARGGGAAFVSGDFEAARARYQDALAKRPDDPDTLNNLGQALVRLGRVDEGIAHFERAVQIAPDAWAPHFNLAAAEGQRGRWDRAVDQYREAVRVFADDYATQFNLALALHKQGDDTAAIAEYAKAIQLAPGEPSFHTALAVSLEKMGRFDDAVREYRVSLEMDPASAAADSLKAHVEALSHGLHTDR
jgi:Flp pilus assembly protein TadD